jgi:hypothetical protein
MEYDYRLKRSKTIFLYITKPVELRIDRQKPVFTWDEKNWSSTLGYFALALMHLVL